MSFEASNSTLLIHFHGIVREKQNICVRDARIYCPRYIQIHLEQDHKFFQLLKISNGHIGQQESNRNIIFRSKDS